MLAISNISVLGGITVFSWSTAVATLTSVLVTSVIFKLAYGLKAVNTLPGLRVPFGPVTVLGIALPVTRWNPGMSFAWKWRKTKNSMFYHRYGCDTVSIVPFISGSPAIYTRSLEVGKQVVVAGHRSGAFGKSDQLGRALLRWGPNIVAVEGELWRKHRKIASPAFNNETYTFVWEASRKLYAEMVSVEGWATKDVVEVPDVHALTFKFAFIIFASVGFGFPFTWANPPAHQGKISIQECMEVIVKTNIFALVAPTWAWKLPFAWLQRIRRSYDTMHAFMHSLVSTTRETIRSGTEDATTKRAKDLFTLLVQASEGVGSKMSLSDDELIGNVFSFMFAGHETTAHTLAATLGFLALNSDLQDELVAQVQEVTQGRDDMTLLPEDYGRLDKVLAAFYEGIRMFPAGFFLIREAKHDTVLDISDTDKPRMLSVKKGTHIMVDMIGIQYNPRYFSEPDEFRASRWYARLGDLNEKDESEGYTAFSIGPRACLGRKFATTEGVCLLASLLREWRVEPLLAVRPNGQVETVDEWRGRVLDAVTIKMTLGVNEVPLKFVRRV